MGLINKREEGKIMWSPKYSLGVDLIDNDHKKLFSVIHKIMELTNQEEEGKARHACREGIKYFKSYTMEHFEREEAFMRTLNYDGYDRHLQIHEDMKTRVLPALEAELEKKDYSMESIRHFLGVCVAWLSTHIRIEDVSIVKHGASRQIRMDIKDEDVRFEVILRNLFWDIYELDIEILSNRYTGWDFGKGIFHEMTFVEEDGRGVRFLMVVEEKMILALAQKRLDMEIKQVDSYLLYAVKEVLKLLGQRITYQMGKEAGYRNSRSGVMFKTSELGRLFSTHQAIYSTLFSTKMGKFACCVFTK